MAGYENNRLARRTTGVRRERPSGKENNWLGMRVSLRDDMPEIYARKYGNWGLILRGWVLLGWILRGLRERNLFGQQGVGSGFNYYLDNRGRFGEGGEGNISIICCNFVGSGLTCLPDWYGMGHTGGSATAVTCCPIIRQNIIEQQITHTIKINTNRQVFIR